MARVRQAWGTVGERRRPLPPPKPWQLPRRPAFPFPSRLVVRLPMALVRSRMVCLLSFGLGHCTLACTRTGSCLATVPPLALPTCPSSRTATAIPRMSPRHFFRDSGSRPLPFAIRGRSVAFAPSSCKLGPASTVLVLGAKVAVAKVANAGDNVRNLVEALVHHGRQDGHLGVLVGHRLDTLGRSNKVDKHNLALLNASVLEHLNGLDGRVCGGQHGVQQEHGAVGNVLGCGGRARVNNKHKRHTQGGGE
mmetsp:Transcript_5346/g.17224  ORF Transcript_5346/g.17224 Transcript_5346/m.17224 type:complete len:250 (-) Transcript_5346:60-809(-)